jgi:hypothetical protein
MTAAITDEIFDQLVPSGTYNHIAPILRHWYGDLADAITLRMPADPACDAQLVRVIEALRAE